MTSSFDDSQRLIESVADAANSSSPLAIHGQGSKAHFVRPEIGDALQTIDHRGVLSYRPDELTITVRSGTPLNELFNVLNERNQTLACDPPRFNHGGTVGGAIATGLCGPSRPWTGSLRDAVLGIEVVNGLSERLNFGGAVMKNVAGFDVSRLYAGSLGALGVILSATLRVHPRAEMERSIEVHCGWNEAWSILRDSLAKPLPVSATLFHDNVLCVRFSGDRNSVAEAVTKIPGAIEIDNTVWSQVRDHEHVFFQDRASLQRALLKRGVNAELNDSVSVMVEWSGSLIWLNRDDAGAQGRKEGHQFEYFARNRHDSNRESKYVERIRKAFDPNRIFNRDIVV